MGQHAPGQGKGQPVRDAPSNQDRSLRQPDASCGLILRSQTGSEVDGDEENDTDRQDEGQKDGDQYIRRC